MAQKLLKNCKKKSLNFMKIKIITKHPLNDYFPKSINTKTEYYQGLSHFDRTDRQTYRQTIEFHNIDNEYLESFMNWSLL